MRNKVFFSCIPFSLQLRKIILYILQENTISVSTCCLPFLRLSENVFRVNPTSISSVHFLLKKLKNSSPKHFISVIIFCFYSPDVISKPVWLYLVECKRRDSARQWSPLLIGSLPSVLQNMFCKKKVIQVWMHNDMRFIFGLTVPLNHV